MDWAILIDAAAFVARELALFAAVGFLVLGASDLAVDLIWISLRLKRAILGIRPATLDTLPPPGCPGRLAVLVPVWHEDNVIGPMLGAALKAWDGDDFRIFVGCYPNDPATIAAVGAVSDPRVRLVIGPRPGPTTKADNLNTLWRAMLNAERAEGRFKAVVLHDAEDVVHSAELGLFDRMIERFDLVQLPVLPLPDPSSRLTAGSYLDEFAESHGKEMVVREALGAGLPSAGVGCAVSRDALAALAGGGDAPFDAESITEDYELGLRLHTLGRRGAFVRLLAGSRRAVIATRGHFPARWHEAVAQKSRWMAGIALAGWDRLGWSGGIAERWMRLRDRQAPLAALLLVIAYLSMVAIPLVGVAAMLAGSPVLLVTPVLAVLMQVGLALLGWRLVMRFAFVAHAYGLAEGLRAVPRVAVSNALAIVAAREAFARYFRARRTGRPEWGKTAHVFPDQVPAE